MKNIVILGSTGSIGKQAIDVVLRHREEFNAIGLAAHTDVDEIWRQASSVGARFVCLVDEAAAAEFNRRLEDGVGQRGPAPEVLSGREGLIALARVEEADTVLNAIVGGAGLEATIAALEKGKTVALANKESMVAAGDLVNRTAAAGGGSVIPVDSEHSAIWQCLVGERAQEVSKLILTASGGPFWGLDTESLGEITPEMALAHPRWTMGKRVTIDSATLMNKGLEVIEARHLFGVDYDRIDVLIHPQSIVHSMVEFVDGSIKAQLGPTDMRLPIQYALSGPGRIGAVMEPFDLAEVGRLDFAKLETGRSRCFDLALEAGRAGRSYPAVLNAADEVAVTAFLSGVIRFDGIGDIIDTVLSIHEPAEIGSVGEFEEVDSWARARAQTAIA